MTLEDFKAAKIQKMKAKDKEGVTALNVLINKIMLAGIEKKAQNASLNEGDIIKIVQKTLKEIEEERDAFAKAGRDETVVTLNKQIEAIQVYLPQMMSEEEIKTEILKLEDKTMPNVMKHFKTNFNGKCDMKVVGSILKSL